MRISSTPPPLDPPPLTVNTPLAEEWAKRALESNDIGLVKEYIRGGHHLGARSLEMLFGRSDAEDLLDFYLDHAEKCLSSEECTIVLLAALASRHPLLINRCLVLPYDLDFRYPVDVKCHEHFHDYPRESFTSFPAPISAFPQQLNTVSLFETSIALNSHELFEVFYEETPFAGQALLIASGVQDTPFIERILQLVDTDLEATAASPFEVGQTPLLRAAFIGCKSTIHTLIEAGANQKAEMFVSDRPLREELEGDVDYRIVGFQDLIKVHPHLSHLLEEEGIEEEHKDCCTIL